MFASNSRQYCLFNSIVIVHVRMNVLSFDFEISLYIFMYVYDNKFFSHVSIFTRLIFSVEITLYIFMYVYANKYFSHVSIFTRLIFSVEITLYIFIYVYDNKFFSHVSIFTCLLCVREKREQSNQQQKKPSLSQSKLPPQANHQHETTHSYVPFFSLLTDCCFYSMHALLLTDHTFQQDV